MIGINNEEKLTLLLSKLSIKDTDVQLINNIIYNATFDWTKFYDYIVTHKTVNIVYKNAIEHNLPIFNREWKRIFESYKNLTQLKNITLYEIVLPILNQLREEGIICIPIKGIILNEKVYKDYSLRRSGDFDILVEEKNLSYVSNRLKDIGFIQTLNAKSMTPAPRRLTTFYRMSTHELVPFALKTSNPICPIVYIDIQFDIFSRAKHTRVFFPLEKLFKTTVPLSVLDGKYTIDTLLPEYNLLQLISHMFRDMTRIQDIMESNDHKLMQFVDIYEFITTHYNELDWEFFASETLNCGASNIVYYVLHYIEQVFGEIVPPEIMHMLRPKETNYLNMYGFEEGLSFEWEMPFWQRLFDKNRKNELNKIKKENLVESTNFINIIKKLTEEKNESN